MRREINMAYKILIGKPEDKEIDLVIYSMIILK
jgi:hypothetical protein